MPPRGRLGEAMRDEPAPDDDAAANGVAIHVPGAPRSEGDGSTAASEAWREAWNETGDVPFIIGSYASNCSGYNLNTRRAIAHIARKKEPEVELQEEEELKSAEQEESGWPAVKTEAGRLMTLAVPIALSNVAGFCINAVGVSFVGRLNSLALSAAVLATSVFNVTGWSALIGFTGVVDTLAGQAAGAGNYRMVGTVLQRALVVNLLFGSIIAVGWLRSEKLFLALGQEAKLSKAAAEYMALVAPTLPMMGITEALKRTLLAQGIVRPPTVVTVIAAILAPLFNWFFIIHLKLELRGAALAVDALQLTSMVLLGSYVIYRNISRKGMEGNFWFGWSWEMFQGWGHYLSLALPSVVMICCKWWSFEALIIMAGWMPDAQHSVATMGVLSIANSCSFMLVFGISMAGATRISNALGAGAPRTARRATFTALGLALIVLTFVISGMFASGDKWVRVLTDVEPVIQASVKLMPVFAVCLVGDGINMALNALLRGAGKQKMGALTNIVSYWAVAIPIAHHLAFTQGWGLLGLWTGAACANTLQAAIMVLLASLFNYKKEAAKAVSRFSMGEPLLGGLDGHP